MVQGHLMYTLVPKWLVLFLDHSHRPTSMFAIETVLALKVPAWHFKYEHTQAPPFDSRRQLLKLQSIGGRSPPGYLGESSTRLT